MVKAKTPNGYIIYRGPSAIDGKPIVVIATGFASKSANGKTGDMIQTWIIREDIAPNEAVKSGEDISICGQCKFRPARKAEIEATGEKHIRCYVKVWQAPLVVWKAYKRGLYPVASHADIAALCENRMVRFGSYGDPYAAPIALWEAMASKALGWTGYSHQWRIAGTAWAKLVMASADSLADMLDAHKKGYRTFRVTAKPFENVKGVEAICPASKEKGAITDCATCRACMGTSGKAKVSIQIARH
jgi:hypothetical protein